MPESVEPRDYESPFPECRVLAAHDPDALLRLDMTRDQAAAFAKRVQRRLDTHDGDGLVTLGLTMREATYRRFATQVGRCCGLADRPDVGDDVVAAQVLIDADLDVGDDGVSVAVFLNRGQLEGIYERTEEVVAMLPTTRPLRWEFSVTPGGAKMLVQQLVAAVQGAEDPLDHVDTDAFQEGDDV